MKLFRRIILLLAMVLLSGCQKDMFLTGVNGENIEPKLFVHISLDESQTKTSDTEGSDNAINSLQCFVCNRSDGKVKIYTANTSSSSISLYVPAGDYRFYILANAPMMNAVTTETELVSKAILLSDNSLAGFVAIGYVDKDVSSNTALNVAMERLVSKVIINKVTNGFTGYLAEKSLSVNAIYLTNVVGTIRLGGSACDSIWHSKMGYDTSLSGNVKDLTYEDASVTTIAPGSSDSNPKYFYTLPNSVTTDTFGGSWCARKTRIVMDVTVADVIDHCYYVIPVTSLARNTKYTYSDIIIRNLGSEDQETLTSTSAVTCENATLTAWTSSSGSYEMEVDTPIAVGGGSATPSVEYEQVVHYTDASTSTITTGGTLAYTGSATGFSLDGTTGVVTATQNTGSERSITPSVTVTMNGETSAAAQATVTQSAKSVTSYDTPVITSFSYDVTATAGHTNQPMKQLQVRTKTTTTPKYTWRSGNVTYGTASSSYSSWTNSGSPVADGSASSVSDMPSLSSNASWLGTGGSYSANSSTSSRSGVITATNNGASATLTVTQAGKQSYSISASPTSLSWTSSQYGAGNGKTVTITCNGTFTVATCTSTFTYSVSGNTITIYPSSKGGSSGKSGIIRINCVEDGSKGVTVTLTQSASTYYCVLGTTVLNSYEWPEGESAAPHLNQKYADYTSGSPTIFYNGTQTMAWECNGGRYDAATYNISVPITLYEDGVSIGTKTLTIDFEVEQDDSWYMSNSDYGSTISSWLNSYGMSLLLGCEAY